MVSFIQIGDNFYNLNNVSNIRCGTHKIYIYENLDGKHKLWEEEFDNTIDCKNEKLRVQRRMKQILKIK